MSNITCLIFHSFLCCIMIVDRRKEMDFSKPMYPQQSVSITTGGVMRCLRRVMLACGLSVFSISALANLSTDSEQDNASEQRQAFTELEEKLRATARSKLDTLEPELAALADYPLYPYLQRLKLQRQISLRNEASIGMFLHQYGDTSLSRPLRKDWLTYLAKNREKTRFINDYAPHLGAELECYYLSFQIELSVEPDKYLQQVLPLWLSGRSQPKSCDPVFRQWQQAGMLDIDATLDRIKLVVDGGDRGLLPYLTRKLPASHQYLARLWSDIKRQPSIVMKKSKFPLKYKDYESELLTTGLIKLAWQQPQNAIKAYYLWQPKGLFSQRQLNGIHRAIALSLTLANEDAAGEWLARANTPSADDDVRHWHLAYMLRQRDWQGVMAVIDSAPDDEKSQNAFRYWLGRGLGALDAEAQGNAELQALANERHYYGFMASAKLAKAPHVVNQPAQVSLQSLLEISAHPSARRARELFLLGRFLDARREWRDLQLSLSQEKKLIAAVLASEWGWYDQAIFGFAQSGYLDDIARRFPMAFKAEIETKAKSMAIDPAMAMAIARRESSFMVDAVSPAGARGLMQVMPNTASYLASTKVSSRTLFEPEQNLDYGIQYLKYLSDKLGDNPVLISASYNAGWRKVKDWLPDTGSVPVDVWIENIPYRETRHYVKAILAYRYIYQWQMGQPPSLFDSLSRMQITPDSLTLVP